MREECQLAGERDLGVKVTWPNWGGEASKRPRPRGGAAAWAYACTHHLASPTPVSTTWLRRSGTLQAEARGPLAKGCMAEVK
jgi:hypothetical protein